MLDVRLVDWAPQSATVEVTCGRRLLASHEVSLAYDLGPAPGLRGASQLADPSQEQARSDWRTPSASTRPRAGPRGRHGWRECVHAPDVEVPARCARPSWDVHAGGGPSQARVPPAALRFAAHAVLDSPSRAEGESQTSSAASTQTDGRFLAIISFDASASDWRIRSARLQPGLRHRAGRVARSAARSMAQAATGPPSEGAFEGLIAPSPLTGED